MDLTPYQIREGDEETVRDSEKSVRRVKNSRLQGRYEEETHETRRE